MKKIILSAILIAGLATMTTAQNARLNLYGSYVFNDQVNSNYTNTAGAKATINGGFQYGLGAEFMVRPTTGVEIKYLHQSTTADLSYYNDGERKTPTIDFNVNYLLLDGNYYFHTGNSNIEPFLGGGIGAAFLYATNTNGVKGNRTVFAWDLKAGTNIFFNKKVGIKLQATLNNASQASGGYYWYGVSTYNYVSMLQFGLGGGLVFRFSN